MRLKLLMDDCGAFPAAVLVPKFAVEGSDAPHRAGSGPTPASGRAARSIRLATLIKFNIIVLKVSSAATDQHPHEPKPHHAASRLNRLQCRNGDVLGSPRCGFQLGPTSASIHRPVPPTAKVWKRGALPSLVGQSRTRQTKSSRLCVRSLSSRSVSDCPVQPVVFCTRWQLSPAYARSSSCVQSAMASDRSAASKPWWAGSR